MLVRKYCVDIAYTPMIISDSFVKSQKARDAEFTTGPGTNVLRTTIGVKRSMCFINNNGRKDKDQVVLSILH